MRFPDEINIGDKYGPAMKITDQAAAKAYFDCCVEHNMRFGNDRDAAETIERCNLGYYAGYSDHETRLRVERLFGCNHPILGKALAEPVMPHQAFMAGMKLAREGDTQE